MLRARARQIAAEQILFGGDIRTHGRLCAIFSEARQLDWGLVPNSDSVSAPLTGAQVAKFVRHTNAKRVGDVIRTRIGDLRKTKSGWEVRVDDLINMKEVEKAVA